MVSPTNVGVVLLYLVCLLLPQAIWLLQNNTGFAVCESCGREGDTWTFVKDFISRRNASSSLTTHSIASSEAEESERAQPEQKDGVVATESKATVWKYSSLCSCGMSQEDDTQEVPDVDHSEPNGGWVTPDDYPDLSGPCNVRRVDVSTLTQQEFEQWFAHSEPLVLTGLPQQLEFKAASTVYQLLKDYGHDIITVATANTHSYHKEKVTLCDYVENMMQPQTLDHLGNETLYYFGDNNREGWSSLFSLYSLPPYHPPDSSPVLSFGLAGPGTGVPFHIHGPTFAETIYGRKRWFLYPPDHAPQFDPDRTTLHWLTHTYPLLLSTTSDTPLECTLHPGEVIYFPDKWWHATLNLDTAVFMSTFYS